MFPTTCGSCVMPDAPGWPAQPSVLAVAPGARLAPRKACRPGGEVLDPRQADPAGPTLADLDSAGDQQLALVAAPTAAARRFILGAAGDQAFVHFDQARQRHALWCDHGPAQLGGEQPCGLVGTQAEAGVAAPRSRWSAWPSDRRPRTTRSAPAWSRASPYRPSPRSACDSRRIHGCMPWSRAPTPGCCRRPDRRSLPASARWPGRRRRLLRLENAVGTPTGNGGSRSFLGIPRVMMFTVPPRPSPHVSTFSWSRTPDKPLAAIPVASRWPWAASASFSMPGPVSAT